MSLFNRYRAQISNQEENNVMTNHLIKQKFDGELRQKMAHRLATDYGIHREEPAHRARIVKMPWIRWGIGLAAACLVGLLAWQNFAAADTTPPHQELVMAYLEVHYPNNELRKGATDIPLQRLKSVDAYNDGDFTASARYRELVTASPEATLEDFFFQGAAYLYQTPPQGEKAIAPLLKAAQASEGELRLEARWHLALAYVAAERYPEARELLQERIDAGTWNVEKATRLLELLPKE